MFKRLLIISGILFAFQTSFSQRWKLHRIETTFGIGATQIFGDIGGTADKSNLFGLKDIRFNETMPAFNTGIRYKIEPQFSLRFSATLGFGNGTDVEARNELRGFSYRTTLLETGFFAEWFFLPEGRRRQSAAMYNRRGMINYYSTISMYAFSGIAPVFFWPKFEGEIRDPDIDKIDGYSKVSLALPLGLGIKYAIDERWQFGAELGGRYALSDFLDGYKQAQSSKHNDVYYFFIINLNYRIKTTPKGLPRFLDKRYRSAAKW